MSEDVQICINGSVVKVGPMGHQPPTRQASQLLILLALQPGIALDRRNAADQIWPGVEVKRQQNSLAVALTMVRKTLALAGLDPKETLYSNRKSLVLLIARERVIVLDEPSTASSSPQLPISSDAQTFTQGPGPRTAQPLAWFVGRREECEKLAHALWTQQNRFVTLVGPGGIGKSALARKAAAESQLKTAWVELVGCKTEDNFLDRLALALGREPFRSLDAAARSMKNLPLLIVMDACEQSQGHIAQWIEAISVSSRIVVLSTSRIPLRLPGERLIRIGPLSLEIRNDQHRSDAAELLRLRAGQEVLGQFDLDPDYLQRAAVLSDGIPLLLEAMAKRIAHGYLPSDALTITWSGEARNDLTWSFEHATPMGQKAWTLVALMECAVPQEALWSVLSKLGLGNGVAELITLGVLRAETIRGYPYLRMLDSHREIALQAAGTQASSLLDELAHGWHDSLTAISKRLSADAPADSLRFLEGMLANLIPLLKKLPPQKQLDLAVDLFPFFYSSIVPLSVLDWVRTLKESFDGKDPLDELRWLALSSFVERLVLGCVDPQREQRIVSQIGLILPSADIRNQCRAMSQARIPGQSKARTYWEIMGDHTQSSLIYNANAHRIEGARRLERASRRIGSRLAQYSLLQELGYLHVVAGELAEAGGHFERALRLARESGLPVAGPMGWIAHIDCLRGEYESGLAQFTELHLSGAVAQRRLLHGHMVTWWLTCALDCHNWIHVDLAERAMDEVWSTMDSITEEGYLARYEARVLSERGLHLDAWNRLSSHTCPPGSLSHAYADFEAGFLHMTADELGPARECMTTALHLASYFGSRLLGIQCFEALIVTRAAELGDELCASLDAAARALRARLGLARPKRISAVLERLGLAECGAEASTQEVLEFLASAGVSAESSTFLTTVRGVNVFMGA